MQKESTYAEKYTLLGPWMPNLISTIKGDLKREHLKKDPAFVKANFSTKDTSRIGVEELTQVYTRVLSGSDVEPLGELVTNLWLLRHGDIYRFFESELGKITTDFTALETISDAQGKPMIEASVREFGAIDTFLFAVLNSVVFSPAAYQDLQKAATEQKAQQAKTQAPVASLGDNKDHERELLRLQEKYEKKLLGLQQKYLHDVDVLKKENTRLRQKLSNVTVGQGS